MCNAIKKPKVKKFCDIISSYAYKRKEKAHSSVTSQGIQYIRLPLDIPVYCPKLYVHLTMQ